MLPWCTRTTFFDFYFFSISRFAGKTSCLCIPHVFTARWWPYFFFLTLLSYGVAKFCVVSTKHFLPSVFFSSIACMLYEIVVLSLKNGMWYEMVACRMYARVRHEDLWTLGAALSSLKSELMAPNVYCSLMLESHGVGNLPAWTNKLFWAPDEFSLC
jgi:hypothetical protein